MRCGNNAIYIPKSIKSIKSTFTLSSFVEVESERKRVQGKHNFNISERKEQRITQTVFLCLAGFY